MLYNNGVWRLEAADLGSLPGVDGVEERKGELVDSQRTFVACQLEAAAGTEVEIQVNLDNRQAGSWVTVETLNDLKKTATVYMPASSHLRPRFNSGADGSKFIAK